MIQEHAIAFGSFRLETPPGRLWQGDHLIPLRPRCLAMLRYLAAHPGRLVTKAEVQAARVGGHACYPERAAGMCTGDSGGLGRRGAGAPRYLATVGRQGYRFLVGGDLEDSRRVRPASW